MEPESTYLRLKSTKNQGGSIQILLYKKKKWKWMEHKIILVNQKINTKGIVMLDKTGFVPVILEI